MARSRSGGQRQGQDTRNSSCSSGANNSGSKKRKFSKIVFEISELPTVYAINRSLSIKRQKDQLNVLKGGYASSQSRQGMQQQISIKDQLAIKSKVEIE